MDNAQWLAHPVPGPPPSTVGEALTAIETNPDCPNDILESCEFWQAWVPGPPPVPPAPHYDLATALAKIEAAWVAYNAQPVPDWDRVRNDLKVMP